MAVVFFTSAIVNLLAELPDKTMISSIVLARTLSRRSTFLGASSALVLWSFLAAFLGQALSELGSVVVHDVTALVLFGLALYLVVKVVRREPEEEATLTGLRQKLQGRSQFVVAFVITFLAEIGDLTQIATASLAARYQQPLTVAVGASLGLIVAVTVAVNLSRFLSKIPDSTLEIIAAVGLAVGGLLTLFG
jgi:putative Ca2+/H+ antiporter (TMEM165/GDT1 family)